MMKNELETRILDLLKKEGLVSTKRIAQELGMDLEAAKPVLNQLWEEQRIGRKLALDTSSADASGGAELWHVIGWKASQPTPPEPKPSHSSSVLILNPEKRGGRPKPAARKPKGPLRSRMAILELLAGTSYPLSAAEIGRKTRTGRAGAKSALRALNDAGLATRVNLGEGGKGNCPTCGAPTFGREVYGITEEGRGLVKWSRENRKPLDKLQALL